MNPVRSAAPRRRFVSRPRPDGHARLLAFWSPEDAKGREDGWRAVAPAYHGIRVAFPLDRALLASLRDRCGSCWFTVKEDNLQARSLHVALGAREERLGEALDSSGDRRLVSRIDRQGSERLRARLERMGLWARRHPDGSPAAPCRLALGAA